MQPGIYFDLSNEDYHGGPGVSKSGLDKIAVSPLHYWQAYLNPDREPRKDKKHFRIGTAIHTAILEPEKFDEQYIIVPEDAPRRPTKTQLNAKKPSDDTLYAIGWWEDFDAMVAANGALVLAPEEKAITVAVAQQVAKSRLASKVFTDAGRPEVSVFWNDPDTGVLCKCRPDWLITEGMLAILDVKSTASAAMEDFQRSAFNYRYHVQAAWYLDGLAHAMGETPDSFMFLAFEKEPPFACAWYFADSGMIEAGRREYRQALETYARCLEKNEWPGYGDQLVPLTLPRWAERQLLLGELD